MSEETGRESSESVSRGAVLASVLGLSFLWPCLGSFATMHFRHAMVGSASFIMTDLNAVIMGAMYLVAAAACLAVRKPLGRALGGPRAGVLAGASGAAGAAGHFLMVTSPRLSSATLATAMVVAGLALAVAFAVMHVLLWGLLLARLPVGRAVLVTSASNALGFAVQLVVDAASGMALLAYLVACPLASLTFWLRANRDIGNVAGGERACASEPDMPLCAAVRGLPWRYVVPTVALIYFEQVLTSLLFQRYADWPRENLTVTLVVSCAIWVAATACLWPALAGRARSRMADLGSRGTDDGTDDLAQVGAMPGSLSDRRLDVLVGTLFAALLVVYMAALLVTVLLPSGDGLFTERLLVAVGCSFRVLLWVVIAVAVWRRHTSPVVGYLAYVLFVLAVPASRLASLAFGGLPARTVGALTEPGTIVGFAAAMLFVLAVVFVAANVWGMRRALQHDASESVAGGSGAASARVDALAALAAERGLTGREAEVLELVCSGYSARHAGERLGISESTVVSHVTHIYRKLGVSSRQELVALVERRTNGLAA